MVMTWQLLLVLLSVTSLRVTSGTTNSQDVAILQSLMSQWSNIPASWKQSMDPCEAPWDGIECTNGRITSLKLPGMNIKGTISGDVGQLSELIYLDLSSNKYLGGPLTANIGKLQHLTVLTLLGCSFTGIIPKEIGNLKSLSFLALNSNNFTGNIPASIGLLSNLYWLDLADNQLTGPLPISSNGSSGLDMLVNVKHFHFNKNKLSGQIDSSLFSARMNLIHILFDSNNFTGPIPNTLGLVKSLEIIRLDNNKFTGLVPTSITNLLMLQELNLANNQLTGPAPNLAPLSMLNSVDLSNNSFNSSIALTWFTSLPSLTSLVMENGGLTGQIPPKLFTLPQIQQVILASNKFNGTLDMGSDLGPQLVAVNLRNNSITSANISSSYTRSLTLKNNPICQNTNYANNIYCKTEGINQLAYTTDVTKCGAHSCPSGQSLSPRNCTCAYPYSGLMVFRAPLFADLSDYTKFQLLESSLWTQLMLAPDSVYLSGITLTRDKYIEVNVALFPLYGEYFSTGDVIKMGFHMSNQSFIPPDMFGPYYFIQNPYQFPRSKSGGKSISAGVIAGIALACCFVLLITLALFAIYALRLKRKAKEAADLANPFASWHTHGHNDVNAPELKGASRAFSFDEIKKCTNSFAAEIGAGGYGKVYKGILTNGQVVAIKRAEQGSMQGAREFKNEIELLSRVNHKHLVKLLGFCCEQGEQMLIYEYISNGSLRDNLVRTGGIHLDWKTRIQIALGSAKGLVYLHEHSDPQIIHRDIKSSNILLDEKLTAKVADFGLSKLMCAMHDISSQVKGTFGYLDPEYYMRQQLSEKSDVYSFGVVMLELITARLPIVEGKHIGNEIKEAINVADQEYYGLKNMMDPKILNQAKNLGLTKFVQLAMKCVQDAASDRPSMNEVVREIEIILENVVNVNSGNLGSSVMDFGSAMDTPNHPYSDKDAIIQNLSSNTSGSIGPYHHNETK